MSEIYSSIDDSNKIILNENSKILNPDIINNIGSIITHILNTIDNNTYSEEDKFELEKCLFNIQYRLKSPTIPTNIKSSLKKVNKMIHNIPSASLNKYIGELYILNNCLLSFNDNLNKPLYKNKSSIDTNIITNYPDENLTKIKHTTIYLKSIVYLFVFTIIIYLFYYYDEN